jgi:hypothetical protein
MEVTKTNPHSSFRRTQSWSATRRPSSVFDNHTLRDTHRNSVYYTPASDNSDLALLSPPPSAARHARRHSFDITLSPKLQDKNPIDRVRQRCHFSKRPSPGWKSRDFVLDRNGKQWTSHPCWHRIMRDQYRYNGQDNLWREERNRFLQEFRRDRQFRKHTSRRFSSSF